MWMMTPAKHNMHIHGLPVLGSRNRIPRLVGEKDIDLVILAMPTASGDVIREITGTCELIGVETKIVPAIYEILDGQVRADQLRDVDIEDLLRREPVQDGCHGRARARRRPPGAGHGRRRLNRPRALPPDCCSVAPAN